MRHYRFWSVTMLMVAVGVCAPAQARQIATDAFAVGDREGKARLLREIALQQRGTLGMEVAAVLRLALQDSDPDVKRRALLAVASRAGGPRFVSDDETLRRWRLDRPHVQGLRALVLAGLRDFDPRVRYSAVIALGNMEYDADRSGSPEEVGDDLAREFSFVYQYEPDSEVRVEIMKGFALSATISSEIAATIGMGFSDAAASVRQYAALGAGRLKAREYVDLLMMHLRSDTEAVRLACAKALTAYGPDVADRWGDLATAYGTETNPVIRQQLARTLRAVGSGR